MCADKFVLNWGIASSGLISADFVNALQLNTTSLNKITAVAARKLEDAESFAKKWSIPSAFGSYQELAKCPNVDIVYIGVVNSFHYQLCTLFLNAGKHVLCEKPLGMNAREVRALVKLAREKGLFLMEGFWSRFFPVYHQLRTELSNNTIGDVQMASATIGVNVQDRERHTHKEQGGGATLDLGCYTIQFVQMIFRDKPVSIQCTGSVNENGVDKMMTAVLTYSGGQVATITSSLCSMTYRVATVSGTKGLIKIDNFWCPESIEVCGKNMSYPLEKSSIPMNYGNSEGFLYEAEAVRQCIQDGLKEHPLMTLEESITIAEIEDEIRKQLGVYYEADTQQ